MSVVLGDILPEVAKGLGYSGFGFGVGYFVCKLRRDVTEIKEAVVNVETDDYNGPDRRVSHLRKGRKRIHDWPWTLILGIIVILLSIATATQSVYFSSRDREITACQARFNEEFSLVLTKRSEYADQDRAAMVNLITAVSTGQGREDVRKALTTYLSTTAENDRLRQLNPLPNLAARNCDEAGR